MKTDRKDFTGLALQREASGKHEKLAAPEHRRRVSKSKFNWVCHERNIFKDYKIGVLLICLLMVFIVLEKLTVLLLNFKFFTC
jgi:hypothetical protein